MSSAVSRKTVVGGDREVESGPAVAVWLASLPEPVETFHMEFVRTSEGSVFGGYRFEETAPGAYLLIGDPFSFPADLLLRHLNERVPGGDRDRRDGERRDGTRPDAVGVQNSGQSC
jgi:small ligand-binding sensory domain FIST